MADDATAVVDAPPDDPEAAAAAADEANAAEFERVAESMESADTPKDKGGEQAPDGEGQPAAAAKPKGDDPAPDGEGKPADEPDMTGDESHKKLADLAGTKPKEEGKPDGEPAPKPEGKPQAKPKPAAQDAEPAPSGNKIKWTDPDTGKETEMAMEDWEKQFPDFAGYVNAKAKTLVQETIDALIADGKLVPADAVQGVRDELVRVTFDTQVGRAHPDWREHAKEGSEFRKWVGRLPAEQQELFKTGGIPGAIALLDAFQARQKALKERAEAATKSAREDKKRRDDLHGGSLDGAGTRMADEEGSADEASAFAKEAERLEREERQQKRR